MLHLSKIKLTVVTNTYNEEWILPHWLSHHVKLFDHGIILDYHSTDSTLEIIKKMAPSWDVIKSKDDWFDAEYNDKQLMDCEEMVDGWKIVLNVTEFVFTNNLIKKIYELDSNGLDMVRARGYQINDTYEEKETKNFNEQENIITQRFHGFADKWRDRIFHKHKNGSYYTGRHFDTPGLKINPCSTKVHKFIPFANNGLIIFWYRFAPFYQQIPRKLQISSKVPDSDKKKGFGWNHWDLTEEKLEIRWKEQLPNCQNLLQNKAIMTEFENIKLNRGF
jgi:hypothetical protein